MTERIVDVEVSFTVAVDAGTSAVARGEVARRTSTALKSIDGVLEGSAVGTSGGEPLEEREDAERLAERMEGGEDV